MSKNDRRERGRARSTVAQPSGRAPVYFLAAALFAITFLIFSRTLSNDFLAKYDDDDYVANNEHIASGITKSSLKYILTGTCVSNWHPVTMLSHALDVQLFGFNPWGHHLTNTALHAVNTVILFLLLRGATAATGRSALVAALFALHPLHVESVATIAQRKDLLSTMFLLIGLYEYGRRPGKASMWRVAIWLVLSLMSKPMAVTFPVLLIVLDFWPLNRILPRLQIHDLLRLITEKWLLFVVAIVMSVVTFAVQRSTGATASLGELPLSFRVQNAIASYLAYLRMTFWPSGLSAFYPYPHGFAVWETSAKAFLLLVITAAAATQWRKRPYLTAGWLWYVVSLIPVIGIVQVGFQAMANRYTYVPLMGIFVAVVWYAYEVVEGRPAARVMGGVAAGIVAVLAAVTWIQTGYWANAETLWNRALAVTSNNYQAHASLELLLADEGRLEEAAEHGYEAMRSEPIPGHPPGATPMLKLAYILQQLGRKNEALEILNKAKAIHPGIAKTYFELASFYMTQGNAEEAERQIAQAPLPPAARHEMIANVYLNARLFDKADAHYREAIDLDPNIASIHIAYARCLEFQGKLSEAIREYAKGLDLDPSLETIRTRILELRKRGEP